MIAKAHGTVKKAAWNVVRLICFAALLVLDDPALLDAYRRRFGVR